MDAAEPVRVRLVHVTAGRARLRLGPTVEEDAMRALADRLLGLGGIRRVLVRPNTGSLILESGLGEGELRALLEGAEAIRIEPPRHPPPVSQAAGFGLLKLDADLKARTDNLLDLRGALGLALIGGGIVQLARGQVAGPATTLLMTAYSLLEPGRK